MKRMLVSFVGIWNWQSNPWLRMWSELTVSWYLLPEQCVETHSVSPIPILTEALITQVHKTSPCLLFRHYDFLDLFALDEQVLLLMWRVGCLCFVSILNSPQCFLDTLHSSTKRETEKKCILFHPILHTHTKRMVDDETRVFLFLSQNKTIR